MNTFQKNIQLLTLAFLTFAISIAHASTSPNDTIYTIQLGTFKDVMNISNFDEILDAGYPYAERFESKDEMSVFVSNYTTKNNAQSALSFIKEKGYQNAFISERPLNKGKLTYVVQLASYESRGNIIWEELAKGGEMYLLLHNKEVKITSIPFQTKEKAREKERILRSIGFKDAFVKQVNTLELHKVSTFNTQKELDFTPVAISIDQHKNKEGIVTPSETEEIIAFVPKGYNQDSEQFVSKGAPATIDRSDRVSIRSFQQFLKAQNTYKGAIDGKYGKGTAQGIVQVEKQLPMYERYQILQMETPNSKAAIKLSPLDAIIVSIPSQPMQAFSALGTQESPIAKAYKAYILYADGAEKNQEKINDLMNAAIRETYQNYKGTAPFDYSSTYAYKDLEQLILHTRYIQAALENKTITPCWLFKKHKKETTAAFQRASEKGLTSFHTPPNCSGFSEWQNMRLLSAIAQDLNTQDNASSDKQQRVALAYTARQNQLFFLPNALTEKEIEQAEKWNQQLWEKLDTRIEKDDFFAKFALPFKFVYHKAWVQLEDHFLEKGFKKSQANALALATLKTAVAMDLENYMK